jgi:hypothetical protein
LTRALASFSSSPFLPLISTPIPTNDPPRTFLNKVINFLGVGFALYGVATVYEMLGTGDPIIKHMVKCKYCRKRISVKVNLKFLVFLKFRKENESQGWC